MHFFFLFLFVVMSFFTESWRVYWWVNGGGCTWRVIDPGCACGVRTWGCTWWLMVEGVLEEWEWMVYMMTGVEGVSGEWVVEVVSDEWWWRLYPKSEWESVHYEWVVWGGVYCSPWWVNGGGLTWWMSDGRCTVGVIKNAPLLKKCSELWWFFLTV